MGWQRWTGAFLVGLLGCGESAPEVPAAVDDRAPQTVLQVVLPGGRALEAALDAPFMTRADAIEVRIVADEPATIVYAVGGEAPDPDDPFSSRGGRTVALSFFEDNEVRWVATDAAGNRSAEYRFEVRFDREPPVVTLTPYGGEFDGPVEVRVEADEPAAVRYTLDGRVPIVGDPQVRQAEAPLVFTAEMSFELNAVVTDRAGNAVELRNVAFAIDNEAPRTHAEPSGGFYLTPQRVRLLSNDPEATIRYTLDGSEPGPLAPIYDGALDIAQSLTLRFRGEDAGGNLEAVQAVAYVIGDRAAAPAPERIDGLAFDTAGGLGLAAELLGWAGLRAGDDGALSLGLDDAVWAAGVEGVDAFVFRAGIGPHGMHAPLNATRAASDGEPDAGGDGSNRDDTWAARAQSVSALVGVDAPVAAHPPFLAYVGAEASLLVQQAPAWTPDGRPAWTADLARHRWSGARVEDRRVTPAASAALIQALVARGLAGTAGQRTGGQQWAGAPADTVGLRCAGCHRAGGASPGLETPQGLIDAGLVVPGDAEGSPLLAWLAGQGSHPTSPAPEGGVAAVRAWVADGALHLEAAPQVGVEGPSAALGVLALDHLALVIDGLDGLLLDADSGEAAGEAGAAYVAARVGVLEAAAGPGLPRRVEALQVEDRGLDVAANAALLEALSGVPRLPAARPTLWRRGPLAESGLVDLAVAQATRLSQALVDGAQRSDGAFAAVWRPGAVPAAEAAAGATAAAAAALVAAGQVGVPGADRAGRAAYVALRGFLDAAGDLAPARTAEGLTGEARTLSDQLLGLAAFSTLAALGEPGATAARDALWARLDGAWWDEAAGAWQTTAGQVSYLYTPGRIALAARAIRLCQQGGGCPGGEARLARVVIQIGLGRLLLADTWLSGEVGPPEVADADGDGLARPEAATLDGVVGLGPVFAGAWRL